MGTLRDLYTRSRTNPKPKLARPGQRRGGFFTSTVGQFTDWQPVGGAFCLPVYSRPAHLIDSRAEIMSEEEKLSEEEKSNLLKEMGNLDRSL
jgi:hypothetical protein